MKQLLKKLFFPKLDKAYLLRVLLVALAGYIFFGFVCIPCIINGASMMPTYPDHGMNFCWCPAYWFHSPQKGDVVIASYIGHRILVLKRVVAIAGDCVEFRNGRLFVNGIPQDEPWVTSEKCNWELPPRTVKPGHLYLIGDNRTMPMEEHIFGQIPAKRILGKPLW